MTARITGLLLLAGVASCAGNDASSAGATATDSNAPGAGGAGGATVGRFVPCTDDPRAEKFVPGMSKRTKTGLEVALVEAEPAPPGRLDNSWTLSIADADGEPVEDAQVTLDPLMPDHGHGSPREPVVTDLGDGRYRAQPIALAMPGYWTIEMSVTLDDALPESVQFGFCVP